MMSKVELIDRLTLIEDEIKRVVRENYELRAQKLTDTQLQLMVSEQLESLKQEIYKPKSERYKKPANPSDGDEKKGPPKPKLKKPSDRYPNVPVREEFIRINPAPECNCCKKQMKESGMTEDSEQLTKIPAKFEIILKKRVKYTCSCQGAITTAPSPARIVEGSSYSDEMIQDVVISKYCDLIPINRYAKIAARSGVVGLPTHSLIAGTHQYADFVSGAYVKIRDGILKRRVLHADETPHKMLEGSDKKNWYLWGFSTEDLCYLECRNTRSGDVASDILSQAECEFLVSDVYAGYGKAVRIANEKRRENKKRLIKNVNCNAHARRYFHKVYPKYAESTFYLDEYHEIYQLNSKSKGQAPPEILKLRAQMRVRFEKMRERAFKDLEKYPFKNKFTKGLNYFLENYEGLTYFLSNPELPIDNNPQERLLRSHVVGRKTWYGTHSQDGAITAAILFSIIETCKLCEVNPRDYLTKLTKELLAGKPAFTPDEYKTALQSQ